MSLEDRVKLLNKVVINEISFHYDNAVESNHGSGDHWILMSVLDKYGFRTDSPTRAVHLAEEIITLWYRHQK
jgi:hypothetical protein